MRILIRFLSAALLLAAPLMTPESAAVGESAQESADKSAEGSAKADVAEISVTAPLHGGIVNATAHHVFETVLAADGIRVYLFTTDLAPAMVEKTAGSAMVKLPDGRGFDLKLTREEPAEKEAAIYFCPMHPEVVRAEPGKCKLCNGMILYEQDRLYGKADLSGVAPADASVMVRLRGLSGREKEATFMPAFRAPDRKAGQDTGTPKASDQPTR